MPTPNSSSRRSSAHSIQPARRQGLSWQQLGAGAQADSPPSSASAADRMWPQSAKRPSTYLQPGAVLTGQQIHVSPTRMSAPKADQSSSQGANAGNPSSFFSEVISSPTREAIQELEDFLYDWNDDTRTRSDVAGSSGANREPGEAGGAIAPWRIFAPLRGAASEGAESGAGARTASQPSTSRTDRQGLAATTAQTDEEQRDRQRSFDVQEFESLYGFSHANFPPGVARRGPGEGTNGPIPSLPRLQGGQGAALSRRVRRRLGDMSIFSRLADDYDDEDDMGWRELQHKPRKCDSCWDVKVVIHSYDPSARRLSGTMHALNIHDAMSASRHTIITFFKGEVINPRDEGIWTNKWGATHADDVHIWSKLPPFAHTSPELLKKHANDFIWLAKTCQNFVLMRWKEVDFVNIQPQHSSLSIAGHYYMVMNRQSGAAEGLYFDPASSPYQKLLLKPSLRQTFDFT